jgi:hypothetical protein
MQIDFLIYESVKVSQASAAFRGSQASRFSFGMTHKSIRPLYDLFADQAPFGAELVDLKFACAALINIPTRQVDDQATTH